MQNEDYGCLSGRMLTGSWSIFHSEGRQNFTAHQMLRRCRQSSGGLDRLDMQHVWERRELLAGDW